MMKKVSIAILATVIVLSAFFVFLTSPVTFDVEPDGDYKKASATDIERPFTVDRDEYPFASNWFDYKGATIHYLDEGEGIPVILCHGNPTWSFLYRNVIKGLDGQARLIAHDLPGFGFSSIPDDFDSKPRSHSEFVNHFLLDELKLDSFIMVVQDWGGPTCLNVAANNPDKVLGLVISNTWAWPAQGRLAIASNFIKTPPVQRLIINRNAMGDMLMDMMLPAELGNRESVLDAYAQVFPTPESRMQTAMLPRELTRSNDWLAEIEARLPALKGKPVQFIFGTADHEMMSEYNIEKWKSYFPEARIRVVEDAKHFTQEDTPESFIEAIEELLQIVDQESSAEPTSK